jgi:hypothetical protein
MRKVALEVDKVDESGGGGGGASKDLTVEVGWQPSAEEINGTLKDLWV